MWKDSVKLPSKTLESRDKDGFKAETVVYTENIPANFLNVSRAEQALANQQGYTADLVIELLACNYAGQKVVVDEATGREYAIRRSFTGKNRKTVQLVCQGRQCYGEI